MKREKLLNVLQYYYEAITLKEVERTGWKYWNVSRNKRIESIPEHIYGTQHLAIAIFSEFDLKIDIFKVIAMLSVHETEEITIGDITPFDSISEHDKQRMGKVAVDKTFFALKKKEMFIELIDEFNKRETPEAIFAYLCDKMECNLQAKKYSDEGRCSFESVLPHILEDEQIKKIIEGGAKTVADVFLNYDANKYTRCSIFSDMVDFLKEYSTK